LSLADVRRVFDICKGLPTSWEGLHCAEFMFDLLKWCKARDHFSAHLWLSAAKLRGKTTADGERLKGFRNGSDCRSKWLPFLKEQGILSCINHRYEKGVYCRVYRLDWEFADGQSAEGLTYREALTKVTDVDEIKDYFKRMTAWTINRLRGKLAAIEEKAETVTLNPDTNQIDEMFGLNQKAKNWFPLRC